MRETQRSNPVGEPGPNRYIPTMARTKESQEALAQAFASHIARGMTQGDAFRAIKPRIKNKPDEYIRKRACEFAAKWNATGRVKQLLRDARATDLYSIGQALDDTLRIRDTALAKDNYNAAQALQRQASQIVGAIGQDTNTVVIAEKLSDVAIIERLALGNPQLAAALAETIGAMPDVTKSAEVLPLPQGQRKLSR